MDIPDSHPRAASLRQRHLLAEGIRRGLVHETGLIAHGRGEAFDYLLGETTTAPALEAERATAAHLILARKPVLSVNGNVAVLAAGAVKALAEASGAVVEVNVFHRTEERVARLVEHLRQHGVDALGEKPDARIPGLAHARGLCCSNGIHGADVVLVPLEDGDRCQALRKMGKTVGVVDLNPLSRTARSASVTIVDEVTRALPQVTRAVRALEPAQARTVVDAYDNGATVARVAEHMKRRLDQYTTRTADG